MNLLGGLGDLDAVKRKRVPKPKPVRTQKPRRPARGGWFVTLLPQEQQTYNSLVQMPGITQPQVIGWLKEVQLAHARPDLQINTNFLPSGLQITGGPHTWIEPQATSTPQPVESTSVAVPSVLDPAVPLVTPTGTVLSAGPDLQAYDVTKAASSQRLPVALPTSDQPIQLAVPDPSVRVGAGGQAMVATPAIQTGSAITPTPAVDGTAIAGAANAAGIPSMTVQTNVGPIAIIAPCPITPNDPGAVRLIKILCNIISVPAQLAEPKTILAAQASQSAAQPSSGPSQRDIVKYLLDFGDMWRANEMAKNSVFDQDWGITPDMTTGLGEKGMSGAQTEKYSLALGLATSIGWTLKRIKDRHPEAPPEPTGDMAVFAAATKQGIAKGGFFVQSGEGAGANFINARLGALGVRGLFQSALGPLKLDGNWGSVLPSGEAEATQMVASVTQNVMSLAGAFGSLAKAYSEVAAAMTTTAPVKLDAAANAQLKQDIMSQAQRNAADQTALDKVAAAAKATAIKWNKANAALTQRIGKYHEHFTSPQQKQQVLRKLKADAAVVASYYRAINKFPGTIIEATRERNALTQVKPDIIIETAKGMQRNPAYDAWWALLDKANNAWEAASKSSADAPIQIALASIQAIRQSKSVADLNRPKRQIELATAVKHQKGKRIVEPGQYVEPRPLHALTHLEKVAAKLESQAAAQEARRLAPDETYATGAPGPTGASGQLQPYPQVPTSTMPSFPEPRLPTQPLRRSAQEWLQAYPQLTLLSPMSQAAAISKLDEALVLSNATRPSDVNLPVPTFAQMYVPSVAAQIQQAMAAGKSIIPADADTSGIGPYVQQPGPTLPSTPESWPPGYQIQTLQPGEMGPPVPFYPGGADILSGLGRLGRMRRKKRKSSYFELPTPAAPPQPAPAPVATGRAIPPPASSRWSGIPGLLVIYYPWIPGGIPVYETMFDANGRLKTGITGTDYTQAKGWRDRGYQPYTSQESLLYNVVSQGV